MMDASGIAAICGAAFLTGFSKSGMPGMGILVPALAAMAMPARLSTGFILPVFIEGDCLAVGYWRRRVEWSRLLHILPWAALGILAGYLLMGVLSDAAFRPLLGAVIIGIVGLDLLRRAARVDLRAGNRILAAAIGILAGALTMIANAAGPVMTIYLLSMGLSKEEFIGTGAWYYFITNLVKLPFSIALGLVTWSTLKVNLELLPLVLLGSLAGILAMKRMSQTFFNVVAEVLAVASGIRMFF
jgi:uncharacterized protein